MDNLFTTLFILENLDLFIYGTLFFGIVLGFACGYYVGKYVEKKNANK